MKKTNKKAFSIIEILVGMVIFFIGISAIYTLIVSTIEMNNTNKNYIIGTSLAREQLELFRNVRDSNFSGSISSNRGFSVIPSFCDNNICEKKFEIGKIYKISNDFSETSLFPIKVTEESIGSVISKPYDFEKLAKFRVCTFEKDISGKKVSLYDYCDNISGEKKELNIFKFIEISEVGNGFKLANFDDNGNNIGSRNLTESDALKVNSRVIWYTKRFQEYSVTSIFTNYKQ